MMWHLRNFGIRLWITALAAVPACFYLMPWVSRVFSGTSPVFVLFAMVVFCYGIVSFLMHLAGSHMIHKLIHEAEVWERAAIMNKARKKYLQAVRIYDSFLLSPLASAKMRRLLTRSVARFSLTSGREKKDFQQAVPAHLATDPLDESLAVLWLEQVDRNRTDSIQSQDLLTCLANIHYDNPRLLPLLTRVFLNLGRKDFSARQLFARAMEAPELNTQFGQKIQALIGEPGHGLKQFPLRPFQEWEQTPGPPVEKSFGQGPAALVASGLKTLGRFARHLPVTIWDKAGFYLGRFTAVIKKQTRWRFYVKTGIMVLLCLWLVIFIYNTLTHLQVPGPVTETQVVIEKIVPKPFTIQVAAYLKDTHADHYVKTLKQKGIDARIKQTGGGGQTWYLIQVSEFEDKAGAAAYGSHLKSNGIIEDFFVSNK
jgi:hypothetical protein